MIFYSPLQSVRGVNSYSPSADKPERFVGFVGAETLDFEPIRREDLYLAHDPAYVDGVFDGTRNNGFENNDPRVAQSTLYTIGSLLAAARAAIQDPATPMCSPTSGFHHAGYSDGGGFCTFNGLMVAALILLRERPEAKIAILDCDVHFGDGTEEILERLGSDRILHLTAGRQINRDPSPSSFFVWLRGAIRRINEWGATVVLYQAGGDMHIDDPLGGILTTQEMIKRDRLVFRGIKAGIAWNLAGGYQRRKGLSVGDPVLDIHRDTLREAARAGAMRRRKPQDPAILQTFTEWAIRRGFSPLSVSSKQHIAKSSHLTELWLAWQASWEKSHKSQQNSTLTGEP